MIKMIKANEKKILTTILVCAIFIPATALGAGTTEDPFWAAFKAFLGDYIVKPAMVIAVLSALEVVWASHKNDPTGKEMGIRACGAAVAIAGIAQTALWKLL